ncbi:MAG: BatA domain-containing protein, partial [Alphaproteobacteria bacterium]
MLALGPLAFLAPWLLLGLAALPLLFWLLRVVPPAPLRVRFPAIRLLFGLVARDEAAVKTPWWLVVLRLALATAVIVGLAHPVWRPERPLGGSGPLILVIDDGWAAARDWEARVGVADRLLADAERSGRAALVVATAPAERTGRVPEPRLMPAAQARALVRALKPKPWPTDRAAALAVLAIAAPDPATSAWLADGIDDGGAAGLA